MLRLNGVAYAVALAMVACSSDRTSTSSDVPASSTEGRLDTTSGPSPALAGGPAIDIARAIRNVHFAFRAEQGAMHGGNSNYDVRVEGDRIAFSPALRTAGESSVKLGAPLRLRTAGIGREHAVPSKPPTSAATERTSPSLESDGSLMWTEADSVKGRLRNDDQGAEQTWDVQEKPAGDGDLVVRVQAAGEAFTATTASGLHFFDAASGLGTRYGDVAWVDANGHRTELTPRFSNGVIEIRVPAELVERSAYPAVLDPTIGPELATDTPVNAVSYEDQNVPVVAHSASGYLVVWQDTRGGNQDIYGARILADGTNLDPKGLVISQSIANQAAPHVASNGTDYLVVWSENNDVFGLRIKAADGSALDVNGAIPISTATLTQTNPFAAFDGTNYLVAWRDGRAGNDDIYARRIGGADGALLDGTAAAGGFAVTSDTTAQDTPVIGCDGTRCLVAWQDARNGSSLDVYAARVSIATGSVLDPTGIAVTSATGDQKAPAVASDGTNFAILWQDYRNGTTADIYGARVVSSTGALADAASTSGIVISAAGNDQQTPALVRTASQYVAVWQDRRGATQDIYGARLGDDLNPVDVTGVALSTAVFDQTRPRLATDGTTALVVWQDRRTNLNNDVVGRRVTASTMALQDGDVATGGLQIGTADNTERRPSVASDGTNALVVWQDNRDPATDIYGVRIALATGTVLDPSGIVISNATGIQQAPFVTFGGGQYFVVWQDRRGSTEDVYGRRIQSDGTLLDGAGNAGLAIVTATLNQTRPRVAYSAGADSYLVVWQQNATDIGGRRVSSAGVLADGAVTTAGLAISAATNTQSNPSVASNGTDFLVVWQDKQSGTEDIYGARITGATGANQDPSGIAISTATDTQLVPDVAFGGGNYLSIWQDRRTASDDIFGTRIDPASGNLLDGTPDVGGFVVSAAPQTQSNPAIAWNGAQFFASFTDGRSGFLNVQATRIRPDATLMDGPAGSGGFSLTSGTFPSDFSAVTAAPNGGAFVAYQRLGTGGAIRVFGHVVSFAAQGAVCTAATDCGSGFCVDGVCCNAACGGTNTSDCQACSQGAGSSTDGTCETIAANKAVVCRAAKNATCDSPEVCDGVSTSCPADVVASGGTACGGGGSCSDAGVCVPPDGGPVDAGVDAAKDASTDASEAGAADSGTPTSDAGHVTPAPEAGTPVSSDAGSDARADQAASDGNSDAGGGGCSVSASHKDEREPYSLGLLILGVAALRRRLFRSVRSSNASKECR